MSAASWNKASVFRSQEFQVRGYFIYRLYATIGQIPLNSEFMSDLAKVSGFLTAEELEARKAAFVQEFMARRRFQKRYRWTSRNPAAFVDLLLLTVGLPDHPGRQSWIDSLMKGTTTRGEVLRDLVDSPEMYHKYYNESFVVMSYFTAHARSLVLGVDSNTGTEQRSRLPDLG